MAKPGMPEAEQGQISTSLPEVLPVDHTPLSNLQKGRLRLGRIGRAALAAVGAAAVALILTQSQDSASAQQVSINSFTRDTATEPFNYFQPIADSELPVLFSEPGVTFESEVAKAPYLNRLDSGSGIIRYEYKSPERITDINGNTRPEIIIAEKGGRVLFKRLTTLGRNGNYRTSPFNNIFGPVESVGPATYIQLAAIAPQDSNYETRIRSRLPGYSGGLALTVFKSTDLVVDAYSFVPGDQFFQMWGSGDYPPPAGFTSSLKGSTPTNNPASCDFKMGFKALHDQIPNIVGNCIENEHPEEKTGNTLQQTSGGLLVWRKADNWTAFTDGYRTWINGPQGLQNRLNTETFDWEPHPTR